MKNKIIDMVMEVGFWLYLVVYFLFISIIVGGLISFICTII